jgi:hypothetical protein
MKTRLVLSLLVVTLGACSTSPADLKPVNDLDATARTQLKDPGAPETAVATWDRAVAALQPGTEGYFSHQLYVDRARFATDQALAELLWDRPQEARQRYLDALTMLHDDVARDAARAKAVNERAQTLGNVAGLGASMLGNVLGQSLHSPYKAQQLQATTQQLSKAITTVAYLDWGGLEQIRMETPEQLQTDFVRMPFFAHFHELASIGHLVAPGDDAQHVSTCTASLVGERLALTNAHCVHDHNGRLRTPSELKLTYDKLVNGRQQTNFGSWASDVVGVTRIHVSPTWQGAAGGTETLEDCGRDWAILELDRHPSGLGFFDVLDGATFRMVPVPGVYRGGELVGDRLVVAGYSGDLNNGSLITMDYGCPLMRTGDWIDYKCATFHGASGSPILLANGPYRLTHVVGVNSCGSGRTEQSWQGYRTREDVAGSATGTPAASFTDLLMQLRAATGTHYTPSGLGPAVPLASEGRRASGAT